MIKNSLIVEDTDRFVIKYQRNLTMILVVILPICKVKQTNAEKQTQYNQQRENTNN